MELQGGHKLKKRKKKKAAARSSQDDYVSSEEDTLDRRPDAASPNRKQYVQGRSPQKDIPAESDLVASSRHAHSSGMTLTLTGVRPEGMTELPDPATLPPPPPELTGDKPVVSYIKMTGGDPAQTDAKYKRKSAGGQYIPLSQSEGSGSDIEKHSQATLKIRRDESTEGAPHMPDVVKSRNRNPEYPPPPYMHKNGGRYIPLNNSEVDSSDGEYNSKLSAHHIAQILGDSSTRGSPKYSHSNTDRPPITFGPPQQRQSELDQLELDSVGSSRSGGSSKSSSGFKTQTASYTDSMRSDSERRNISDSDSAKSSTSSSTFPRSQTKDPTYGSKYFMTLGGGRQNGHTSPATDSEGSSPRLVDEAYGTMGSNGTSTLRGR